jgi:hypothetical protein
MLGRRQLALGEIGQFEILEKEIDEFLVAEREAELVLALPVRTALRAAPPPAPGAGDAVSPST